MFQNRISRRTFLKAAAVTGAGLSILGPVASGRKRAQGKAAKENYEWVPNVCTMCVNTCGIKVKVKKTGNVTRAVKIEGNPYHPYNRGKICARGQAGLRRIYDPNRITQPLVRVEGSKRGEWNFKAVSWDEAYGYIMKKMQQEKIQPWEIAASGGWISCAFYRPYLLGFALSMQIPNILATPMQHCVMAEHFGIDTVTGNFNVHDEIVADYENARFILSVGSNAAITAIATGRAVRFAQAKKKGMRLVALDPRLSELAAKADEWIPIKPGTDLAFLLAVMHVVLKERYYDADFVRAHTNAPFLAFEDGRVVQLAMEADGSGNPTRFYVYDELSASVKAVRGISNTNLVDADGHRVSPALEVPAGLKVNDKPVKTVFQYMEKTAEGYTPQWASAITDVPAQTIERVATEFGTTRPAMIEPGWHDPRFGATQELRRVATILQSLIGGIDTVGGWQFLGGYHEMMYEFLDFFDPRNAEKNKGKPFAPVRLPGIKSPQMMLNTFFNNPDAWQHKHPGISEAWNRNRWASGQDGVAFSLFTDAGYKDASDGKL
ncbi:MAG: molybdopterin-dependent oxidoreductase, partial [Firmicutes bacterium]|nr:molybdopterin-dependent oxidoreductase [Bacillota bacterium]